jgi:ABC-type transporter Mla MlaB component
VLKITITETETEMKWTLQGRLVAPWVGELRKSWAAARKAGDGRTCAVDLNDVTHIDEGGEKLLRTMAKEGAELIGNGVFIKQFLEELQSGNKRGSVRFSS